MIVNGTKDPVSGFAIFLFLLYATLYLGLHWRAGPEGGDVRDLRDIAAI
jgi:hypothetical protein